MPQIGTEKVVARAATAGLRDRGLNVNERIDGVDGLA